MEKKIAIENPWYEMISSPQQEARRQARMKRDAKVYRKKAALWVLKIQCAVLAAALAAVAGIWFQLGA